ncbi:PadR family transcriptional regulator [Streptomyces antimicrobicus]|uniref:PadR family transcriptional regulator n=1 Tax=Streptomyces antimicrobicus TaxID=2883108 RepID=A0ABS8B592_9ACTN|nr:PadR family transcriptional regulator [Streptomyces antimicrobicus]MCB5179786.1 PadR family transcriptional regulator [Streptomyces antimicrobicus]
MSLRHAVLGLLAGGPASGYDLLRTFDLSLANVWPATQSQLYGELGKLEKGGLVAVAAEGPRGRKEYAITDAGRDELHHWLTEVEPTQVRRSDMLLRVFFLDRLERDEALAYLRRQAELAAERHERLVELGRTVAQGDDPLSVYGRIAMEWGLRASATQRAWAEWAQEQLAERQPPAAP